MSLEDLRIILANVRYPRKTEARIKANIVWIVSLNKKLKLSGIRNILDINCNDRIEVSDVNQYFSKLKMNFQGIRGRRRFLVTLFCTFETLNMSLAFAYKKLFTKEDPIYLHKTLGIASLLSFFYRYAILYPTTGSLGFEGTFFDWFTILLHVALSTSSLIFRVLAKRIINRPMVIWEEYRLHAVVFTLRALIVYSFGIYRPFKGTDFEGAALFVSVMSVHLVVDAISRKHGLPGVTTVRVQDNTSLMYAPKRLYGLYQFLALGSHIVPHDRMCDLAFNALIAIQSSAFLMTLYRKGLIRWYTHAFFYSAALLISTFHILRLCDTQFFFAKVLLAFGIRIAFPKVSKYVIWVVFALLHTSSAENLFRYYMVGASQAFLFEWKL